MRKSPRERARIKGGSRREQRELSSAEEANGLALVSVERTNSFLELFENGWSYCRINLHTSDRSGFEHFAALEIGFARCECKLHSAYSPKIGAALLDCRRCWIDIQVQRPNIAATRD